jgi:predicted PurR-regulated permease PerM
VLVPRLVGEKIGLHPLAVIFAILAGGELFGFLGVLLALPIASVAMVLLRYAHERYRSSGLYRSGREAVIVVPSAAEAAVLVAGIERPDSSSPGDA